MTLFGLTIYEAFNYLEGFIWLIVAAVLPLKIKAKGTKQKSGIVIAMIGFAVFGFSDFCEASRQSAMTYWLWALKVVAGATILAGKFTYLGWSQFAFSDRHVRFGLFCLLAVGVLIFVQMRLNGFSSN